MTQPNFYASVAIDRAALRRTDAEWIAGQLQHPEGRMVPVWRARSLIRDGVRPEGVFLPIDRWLVAEAEITVFLGLVDGVPHFAVDLSHHDNPPLAEHGRFQDMRGVGPLLTREEGGLLVYARAAVLWHARHRFCGACGATTEIRDAGFMRHCTNAACALQTFPRLDPAVIMLVHDGADRVILGRQKVWAAGMHSVLAGFVEPGESLEDAVAREVLEEVGVEVADIRYHSSQPWPFPSSIMLGFTARARGGRLDVNLDELEGARWFHRDDLRASPEDASFSLPRKDSVSRRLIEDWLHGR